MTLRSARDTAPRIRAARSYADLTHRELAKESGISYDRIRAMEAGDRDVQRVRAADGDELRAIAKACKVPYGFMERGFGSTVGKSKNGDVELRLAVLEAELGRMQEALVRAGAMRAADVKTRLRPRRKEDRGGGPPS